MRKMKARTTDCAFVTSETKTVSIAHAQRARTGRAYIYKHSDADAKQMGTRHPAGDITQIMS